MSPLIPDVLLEIEGQTEVFSIPEDLPFGEVVETRIVIADRTFILRTGRAATGGPVVTPTIDQNLSPFLQTATAAAPRDLASPTAGPTAIPSAGGADLLGGNSAQNLTVLAMIGAALVGLAFVVRRMRSTLSI